MNHTLSEGDKYYEGVLKWRRVAGELEVLPEEVEWELSEEKQNILEREFNKYRKQETEMTWKNPSVARGRERQSKG